MISGVAIAIRGALADMIADIDAGRVYTDRLEQDFAFIRHLVARHEGLLAELQRYRGGLRGPGSPGWREA